MNLTRCPMCGIRVTAMYEEAPWWVAGPCGDRLTPDQAQPILHARGDDT